MRGLLTRALILCTIAGVCYRTVFFQRTAKNTSFNLENQILKDPTDSKSLSYALNAVVHGESPASPNARSKAHELVQGNYGKTILEKIGSTPINQALVKIMAIFKIYVETEKLDPQYGELLSEFRKDPYASTSAIQHAFQALESESFTSERNVLISILETLPDNVQIIEELARQELTSRWQSNEDHPGTRRTPASMTNETSLTLRMQSLLFQKTQNIDSAVNTAIEGMYVHDDAAIRTALWESLMVQRPDLRAQAEAELQNYGIVIPPGSPD